MRRAWATARERRRRMNQVNVALVAVGLFFLLAGVRLATTLASEARATAERVERLTPLSATAIDDSPAGREALVEGHISDRNPALVEDLVAYIGEEYRGRNSWENDGQRTPPLRIELPDGAVVLADSPYRLDDPPHRWEEPGGPRRNDARREGTRRYRGFRAGDPVIAVGTLVAGSAGMELRADVLASGTRSAYLERQSDRATFSPWVGGLFGLIGAAALGAGIWRERRRRQALRSQL